jgi:hypothetical protein
LKHGEDLTMPKVILDETLRAKLNGLNEPLELCDETGGTLGHFLPADVYREIIVAWSKARTSDEELERRMQQPGGRTLAEIWQRLGRP